MPDLDTADDGPVDLRLALAGCAAWAGGLAGDEEWWLAGLAFAPVAVASVLAGRERSQTPVSAASLLQFVVAMMIVGGAVWGSVQLRAEAREASPLLEEAERRTALTVTLKIRGDPRVLAGPTGTPGPGGVGAERTLVRVHVVASSLHGGSTLHLRAAAVVLGDSSWMRVRWGETWQVRARLMPGLDESSVAVTPVAQAHRLQSAGVVFRAAESVRAGIRRAVRHAPEDRSALVPALVVGDDAALSREISQDFASVGLTHLLAVSGTNLTLMVGFVLVMARWCGVRGRWAYLVGALGIVGFILIARPEPSVLRAAAMGTVALIGLGHRGARRGSSALGAAVVVLLLVDPGLAVQAGFALSVLATAGILTLAPGWRDALATWVPRFVAEAVAVPAAAQLACTPVVAAISGQVSLVAVATNLLAAPAVGPATVLGLLGGLLTLLWDAAGQVVAWPATWCVGWIIELAEQGADLPNAAMEWGSGAGPVAALTLLCAALVPCVQPILRRPRLSLALAAMATLLVVVGLPSPRWPPPGWVFAACDVGQGDALVVRVGPGSAIVVDAGPDPRMVRGCLDRLEIAEVPLVVLTHFDADHVLGLPGVLAGRRVGRVETSWLPRPEDGAFRVRAWTREAGIPLAISRLGTRTVGEVMVQTLATGAESVTTDPNDASVVLWVRVRDLDILLTGDLGQESQRPLRRLLQGLHVDVLKIPHHGSKDQDLPLLTGLTPQLALASVGAENTYGHPAADLLEALSDNGARVARTDRSGDLVVVVPTGSQDPSGEHTWRLVTAR